MKIWRIVFVVVVGFLVFGGTAVAAQAQQQVQVSVQRANVRDMPSTRGEVIFQVSQDEVLKVIQKEGDWYWVENSTGRRGYISNMVVRLVESSPELKVPSPLPVVSQGPTSGIFRNSDVIAMVKAGLSDSIIIAAIRQASQTEFDLSPAGLISLKNGGVSEAVIQTLINRSIPRSEETQEVSSVKESPIERELLAAPPQQVPPTQPQVRNPSVPGRFGAGLQMAAAPGGAVPSILYDLNDRLTVNGAVGFYYGAATGFMGELLYRFPRPPTNTPSEAVFEPYLGGGVILVSVRSAFRVGQGTYTGFVGSGGTFLTFSKIPRWRFSGDINLVQFNVEGIVISGAGIRIGFHYFF